MIGRRGVKLSSFRGEEVGGEVAEEGGEEKDCEDAQGFRLYDFGFVENPRQEVCNSRNCYIDVPVFAHGGVYLKFFVLDAGLSE